MRQGLLAGLIAIVTLACTSGPTATPVPTTTPGPTRTVGAQPTATGTAVPTDALTAAPTVSPTGASLAAWIERTDVAPGPSAREDHTWTVDADGQVAYLFGGRTADGPQADLWAFDLAADTWTELRPTGPGPAARFGHTATWVAGTGLVVWSGQGRDFFDDIWAFDPAVDAWRELPSLGAVPEARYGSCASLGPDGRLWISHGFTQDDGRFADTRAYDFRTGEWTDMTPSGEVPVKRCLHDCYWSDAGELVLYGGQTTGAPALGDVWAYDPESATWRQGPAPDAPPRQLYAIASTTDSNAHVLVFGGGALDGGFLADTWAIDQATLSMTEQALAGSSPAARSGAVLLADPMRARTMLFGGQNESGLLADLWELSVSP